MAIEEDQLEATAAPAEAARPRRLPQSAMDLLRRGRLPRVLIAMIAGTSVSLVGAFVYLYRPENEEQEIPRGAVFSVADALAALDAGAPLMAQRMATRLAELGSLVPDDAGGPPYIFGVVAANDAERLWGDDQKRYFRLAARYLEQSQDKGFPAGREAEGLLLLGKSLLMCGQVAESRNALEQALKANPQAGADLHRLLVLAYKSDPEPIFDRALLHSATYLAEAALTRNERAEGLLHRAEILFHLQQNDECRQALSQIEAGTEAAVESLLIEGELLMREGAALLADEALVANQRLAAAKIKYQAAIDVLRRAQNRGTERERITRRSMYLIGRCLLQMEELPAALDQFRRTRETYEDTPEGIAAALEEAEVAQRMGQDKDLAQRYIHLLQVAGASETYYNPLLTLDALRQRLALAYQRFIGGGDFASAIQLAEALYPLFPRDNSITLMAQSHTNWAQVLESQAAKSSGDAGNQLKNAAREQRRLAATAYATLAQLNFATDRYTEDVWNSAENYLRGQDYPRAEVMLLEYLKYQLRRRRPRALLDLGDAQLALGKPTQALVTLQECIDTYARDPASYRARLIAARAQMERGSLPEAKRLLLANLEGTELDPESVEWRDSLFSLGALLHDEGQMFEAQGQRQRTEALASNATEKATAAEADLQRAKELYEQAARRLEEAVARYPDVAQVVESRYVIAESHRALARFAREKLERAKIETTRLDHSRELHRLLQAAIVEYEQVQDILTRRRERSQLSPLEQAILRNCYFARGAAFYELGRFDDAAAAYAATTNRYHDEPEVLDAFLQLAQCYRQIGKPDEAQGVIEQAKAVLQRMPEDIDFKRTTNHSRQEWERVLDWAAELSGPQADQPSQP
ncbi:MAG: tetratricopeptide repeat protein [Pirellulales bacterium]